MNRILAETLSAVNGIIALVIVLAGAYIGYKFPFGGSVTISLGTGLVAIVESLVCGVVSYLALIEGHLAKIASKKRIETISAVNHLYSPASAFRIWLIPECNVGFIVGSKNHNP